MQDKIKVFLSNDNSSPTFCSLA